MPMVKKKRAGCWKDARQGHLHTKRWGLHRQNADRCWKIRCMSSGLQLWLKCWFANCRVTSYKEGSTLRSLPNGQSKPRWCQGAEKLKTKSPKPMEMSNGKKVRWNFPFILTSDIFKATFKGAIWKALGKNKTKNTKENKPTLVSGSTWSVNTCVGRDMRMCTTAITRAWLETRSRRAGEQSLFFHQT